MPEPAQNYGLLLTLGYPPEQLALESESNRRWH